MILKLFTFYDDPPASPPPSPPPPPPSPRTFTQAEVDKLMADHRKGLQSQNAELVKQLEELRTSSTLTQQQKDELDARIQTLTSQHQTKEQQLSAELERATKKYKTDTENLANEGKKWRSSYDNLLIENAIRAGSSKHQAASVNQMIGLLQNKAKVVEVVDEKGQGTGQYTVKIPLTVTDPKTKQMVTVEFDAVEAIGKMREDSENSNLFLYDGKPGMGGTNVPGAGGSGNVDWANLTPEQHRELRKK